VHVATGYVALVSWISSHSAAIIEREANAARAMTLVAQTARVAYEKTLRYGERPTSKHACEGVAELGCLI
jgi:hypothetical protein